MRDPNRLDNFYMELCKIHKEKFPDWRFGQFISNLITKDPFYLEEEDFLKMIKNNIENM